MELKQRPTNLYNALFYHFNRTNMELKLTKKHKAKFAAIDFNRTNMELKHCDVI